MPIECSLSKPEIMDWYDDQLGLYFEMVEETFKRVGEEAVTISRQKHKYVDRTGNLTSSIGYILVKDGKIVTENFKEADGNLTDKNTGLRKGQEYAKKHIDESFKGFQLILVAGMPYASYVEARGYDVLDSAEIHITNTLDKKLKQVAELWGK